MNKNLIKLTLLLGILLFFPQLSQSQDIHSILSNSVGGKKAVERIKSLKTVHAVGSINMNGALGQFDLKMKFPNKYKYTITFPDYAIIEAYDGTIAWQQDISGRKSELTGSDKRSVVNSSYLNFFSYLFDDSLQKKINLGTKIINGKNYHKILLLPNIKDSIFTFFNTKTGQRELYVTKLDMVEIKTIESSFQIVDHINFPFSSISFSEKYNISIEQNLKRIVFDKPFDDSIFVFQKEIKSSYLFSPKEKFTVDFELQNGHIFVPVTLNGRKKVYMLLDSGAGNSILHLPLVKELNLDSIGTVPSVGISGASQSLLVKTDSTQIGNIIIYNQILGSIDLKSLVKGNINKVTFGGILGNDFLSQYPTYIDYQEKKLTIYNPESYKAPAGGNRIPFEYYMLIPTVNCKVGSINGKFIIDLGNAFGLILHHQFVKNNNIANKISEKVKLKKLIGGVGGAVSAFEGILDSFLLGNSLLRNEKVYLPQKSIGLAGSNEISGNIGNAMLKRYNLFFDFLKNEIILYNSSHSQ